MKHPFIKFYVRDWTGDQQLRMVSLSARGLWIECICIMHTAKRYGFLETPMGVMFDDETLARLIGASIGDLYRLKDELLTAGIPSVEEPTGIWFSRRMVKEMAKAEKCAEAGKKGGGNPSLTTHPKNTNKIPDTRNHISLKVTNKGDLYRSEFDSFWKLYPKKIGRKQAEKKYESLVKKYGHEKIMAGLLAYNVLFDVTDTQFIPFASTWLNKERFLDDPSEIEKQVKAKKQPQQQPPKQPKPIWHHCAARCRFWDESKNWCTKFEKVEPTTPDHCHWFN